MLIKSKTDYDKYLRTANHLEFDALAPYFESVQADLICEIFGIDFINLIDTRYNQATPSPALSTEETYLIKLFQKAIASMGMVNAIPFLLVNVQGSGIETAGNKEKSLPEWKKLIFENELLENGWNAIGSALDYLFLKRDDTKFALWKNSTEEKTARQYLINNTKEFNNCVQIARSTRTFEALKPSIKQAIIEFIEPVTGTALLTEIITQNKAFTLSEPNKILVAIINEALAQLTMSIGIYKLEMVFNEQGARVVSVSATSGGKAKTALPGSENMKALLADKFISTGNVYINKLQTYLDEHAVDYPLYPVTVKVEIDNSSGCVVL